MENQLPPKVHHFMWRFSHNSHPLHMNIARRGVELDTRCVVCNKLFEDGVHLFLRCKEAKKCWRALDLEEVRLQLCSCPSPLELLEKMPTLANDVKLKVVALLWCWWRERNKQNHNERRLKPDEFACTVLHHVAEWKNQLAKTQCPRSVTAPYWMPPPTDTIKINVDGSFIPELLAGGWGAIARNHSGDLVVAACGHILRATEALQTELMPLVQAIPMVEQLGIGRVIFATDCTELKQAMCSNSLDLSRLGHLVRQAKFMLRLASISFSVEYCPRACNIPVHKLAALGGSMNQGDFGHWLNDLPPDVMSAVANDLVVP
ncbi:hypothetical protein ACQ4PT_050759 [Festuca glaucescens]